MLTAEHQARVNAVLSRADAYERKHVRHGYYLEHEGGRDAGEEWCERCVKVVRQEKSDADQWRVKQCDPSANHDCPCHCAKCGRALFGFLTDYGMREELDHYQTHGLNLRRGYECYLWGLCHTAAVEGSPEWNVLLGLLNLKPTPGSWPLDQAMSPNSSSNVKSEMTKRLGKSR